MEPLLGRLALSVSGAEDLEGLTRPLLELLEAVTQLESTYLTRIDTAKGRQHILFSRNVQAMQIPEGLSVPWHDTLCKRALDEQRPYTDDVSGCWSDSDAAKALGIKTYLSQPVYLLDGEVYGTLCGASASRVAVSPDTIKVLALFAKLISHQVERERALNQLHQANQELRAVALTDPLTGVANRRALLQEVPRTLSRARRDHATVQIAFIDLDGFKAINDRYGHEVGDGFLAHMAGRLASSIRPGDFIARYGGDEFVVLTSNASAEGLRDRLEQLTVSRYERENLVIEYGGASVGVTVAAPDDDADVESLLAQADAAMYVSKRARKACRVAAA